MTADDYSATRRMILMRGLFAPVITLLVVCAILVCHFAICARTQISSEMRRVAEDHCRMIDQFLSERVSDLQFAAASHSIRRLRDEDHLAALLGNLQVSSPAFCDLGVFDENGNHLAYVGAYDLAGKQYADTEWFRAVRENGLYVSDVFLGYRRVPHFIIAVRRDEAGDVWYLRATVDTQMFDDVVRSIRMGRSGEAYLISGDGRFQTTRWSGGRLMEHDPDHGSYRIAGDEMQSFTARGHLGGRFLYVTSPLDHADWTLVVRQEASDAYGPLNHAVLIAGATIVVGILGVAFMAFVLAARLAHTLTVVGIEKHEVETQLIMAGKLAEVGEMSAGVAHEINNPLQVMESELTMIDDLVDDMADSGGGAVGEPLKRIRDAVNQVRTEVARCGRITGDLLSFARQSGSALQTVEVGELLSQVVSMIDGRARLANIVVIQEVEPELPAITGDANQLQQVFVNLLNNALYALKDRERGEIRVTSRQDGDSILTTIADNGCGIPPEDRHKIFVPFFTTKPPGEGTGLGLSSAYGIVKGIGGDIDVTSESGTGTVFTIRLPVGQPGTVAEVSWASDKKGRTDDKSTPTACG